MTPSICIFTRVTPRVQTYVTDMSRHERIQPARAGLLLIPSCGELRSSRYSACTSSSLPTSVENTHQPGTYRSEAGSAVCIGLLDDERIFKARFEQYSCLSRTLSNSYTVIAWICTSPQLLTTQAITYKFSGSRGSRYAETTESIRVSC